MLIRTKWIPPRSNFDLVSRRKLLDKLDASASGKLTLVCAPAGFGKTTLVIEWLQQFDRSSAWLSLDKNDNDLSLFVAYLVGAVESIIPNAWRTTAQMLLEPDMPGLDELAVALLNDIQDIARQFILAIDDYHLVHNTDIHDLMRVLLEHLPANAHIVLISRTDPPLPLPKLLMRGEATNLRVNDLRFTSEEAEHFLQISGHAQDDSILVENLNRRLEGWIAGLRLVSLSLDSVDNEADYLENLAVEPDGFVAEYLLSEVLEHLPQAIRAFLLQTSILERFCTDLCETVIDDELQGQSAPILAHVQRANLFIVPLDNQGSWFRYHHLFQKILQQRLRAVSDAEQLEAYHRKAFRWFSRHDFSEEALHHALQADDIDSAVELVEAKSRNLLNGLERRTLRRWIEVLPTEIVWQRPRLLLAKAWLLYRYWRLDTLDAVLDTLAVRLGEVADVDAKAEEIAERQFMTGQMNALKSATLFHLHFDMKQTISAADKAMADLPATEGGALSTAAISRAFAKVGICNSAEAIDELMQLWQNPAPPGPAKTQLLIGILAVYYLMGDLVRLNSFFKQAGTSIDDVDDGRYGGANLFAGMAAFGQGRLVDAKRHHTAMYNVRHKTNYLAGFTSGYSLVRIHQVEGEFKAAQDQIDHLRNEMLRINNQEHLRHLDALQAYHWLQTGKPELAIRWAKHYRVDDSPDSLIAVDPPGLIWARICLTAGDQADVEHTLSYLSDKLIQLQETQFDCRKLQLLAHKAAALALMDDMPTARICLRDALKLGQNNGNIRGVADVGESLLPVLRRLNEDDIDLDYKQAIIASIPAIEATPIVKAGALLTLRENEILHMIQYGQSNQEIAAELTISVNTVKRHISNIYKKLGASNRQQAIYRAKKSGFLS